MNNLGITISFVIGGLLLVALLTLTNRVEQNSGETVLNITAKNTIDNVTQIMRRDFTRIGYNMANSQNTPIKICNKNEIVFLADIDDQINSKAHTITWKFTDQKYTASKNKYDYKLIRTGTNGTTEFPIIYENNDTSTINFRYFDKDGNATSEAARVRTIAVSLQTQSAEKYKDGQYATSFLTKQFTPPSLRVQDIDWKN